MAKESFMEKYGKVIRIVIGIVVFIVGLVLVIEGQKNIGPSGLGVMMIGLCMLLGLMYAYNHQYE